MRSTGFAFIAPLLVLMVVAFNLPILYMLGLAFWDKGRGFTLEHYEGLLEAPVYLRVLGNTMRIALIATIANVAIGYPLAHWMRGLRHRARLIAIALVVLPFWVSDPGAHLCLDRGARQRRAGEPRCCNGSASPTRRCRSSTTSSASPSAWPTCCCRSWCCRCSPP